MKKTELWIGFYKKASGIEGITPAQAIDEALCFGWIDGIRKKVDELRYMNRYTPRTAKSGWSKINVENVERLLGAGLILPEGLRVIEEAKADGRWARAYDSAKTATVPADFLKELRKNKKAAAFFKTLGRQNVYAIVYRLQKPKKLETRQLWIERIIGMLERGETFQ